MEQLGSLPIKVLLGLRKNAMAPSGDNRSPSSSRAHSPVNTQGGRVGDGDLPEVRGHLSQEAGPRSASAREETSLKHHESDGRPISTQSSREVSWQPPDGVATNKKQQTVAQVSEELPKNIPSTTHQQVKSTTRRQSWIQQSHAGRHKGVTTDTSLAASEADTQVKAGAPAKVNGVSERRKPKLSVKIPPPPPHPRVVHRRSDDLYCTQSSPVLPVYRRKVETMPSGNKVADMDTGCWRRTRPPMLRGTSSPSGHDLRPKSAEFHLDLRASPKRHAYYRRGHSRSPSDGDKPFLSILRSSSPKSRTPSDTPTPSSPKSPGLLKRVFGLRRSLSRDREREHNRNKQLDCSGSFDELEQNNNNHNTDGRSRTSRRLFSNNNNTNITRRDENQNEAPVSPPIAVFSSDEDISSAPATPRHYDNEPLQKQDLCHGPNQNRYNPDEEHLKVIVDNQGRHKRMLETNDTDGVRRRNISPHGIKDGTKSPKRFFGWRESSQVKKYDRRQNSADHVPPELPPSPIKQFTKPEDPHCKYVDPNYKSKSLDSNQSARTKIVYGRQRHHTVDLANIVVHAPDGDAVASNVPESSVPICKYYSSPNRTCRSASPLVCTGPPSWTQRNGSPSRPNIPQHSPPSPIGPPATQTLRGSYGGSESESIFERGCGARRGRGHWYRHRTNSQDADRISKHMTSLDISSTDSGIQQDGGQSSSESLRTPVDDGSSGSMQHVAAVLRRRTPHASPEKAATRERPKSEVLMVRWADNVNVQYESGGPPRRLKKSYKERPKSDVGGGKAISDALEQYELKERFDSLSTLPDLSGRGAGYDQHKMKPRRMSTPHPIKMRLDRSPPAQRHQGNRRRPTMQRSRSAPDLLHKAKKSSRIFQVCSLHAGDLAIQHADFSSDEEETSEDGLSLGTASETSSLGSFGKQAILDEIYEKHISTLYVEALWDHVTLDQEELGFRAGDVIEVTDMADKDWWWGRLDDREGWFPATFVRLRANQAVTADDLAQKVKEGMIDSQDALKCYSTNLLSKEQARTNVVNEIIHAEREYVKHLKDVVQGYVEKARKRPEMFSEERMHTIFGNIEEIYTFSSAFLRDLEVNFIPENPQKSELGTVFLKHSKGFEIYSEYCNNHPQACEELRSLQRNTKYQHFFEACRLLQQMIEIPLEGFLLTPVQKICKYPLQLAELLKYTRTEHKDYGELQVAHATMKGMAVMINERKRKMESIEKLARWQDTVQDWEGPDLLENSSELIHAGELSKVNSSGWSQERSFFLFDHQLIYCKKDLLWRDVMVYKGSIDLDNCDIIPLKDGKESQFGVSVKNGWKMYDKGKDKWFLMCGRTSQDKDKWLRALVAERRTVQQDMENGFSLAEYRDKALKLQLSKHISHPQKLKDKGRKRKVAQVAYLQQDLIKTVAPHATFPRQRDNIPSLSRYPTQPHPKPVKRTWLPFNITRKSKSGPKCESNA